MGLKSFFLSIIAASTRKKPVDVSSDQCTKLNRCLSTLDLTFIGIGTTLGSGIYVLTGEVAKEKAGPAVVISFVIAAIASILSGLCYAELGARFPKAGSSYTYCYVAIGELCAFLTGWNILMENVIGGSTSAKAVSEYIDSLTRGAIKNETISLTGEIHVSGFSDYFNFLAVILVAILTLILAFGVKHSARLNNCLVALNVITILIVTIAGLSCANPKNWSDFAPYGFSGIVRGASTCFFAFIGFDVIATTCEEAQNPGKSIPLSIVGTIVICAIEYVGVSCALTLMVPYYMLNENAALSTAFAQSKINFMVYVVGIGASISLIGCVLNNLLVPPRLLYAFSIDGLLPKMFSKVHARTSVPLISTVISGVLIAIMAAVLELQALVEMLSIGTLFAYSIVDISILLLRYRLTEQNQTSDTGNATDSPCSSDTGNSPYSSDEKCSKKQRIRTTILRLRKSPAAINAIVLAIVIGLFGVCVILAKFSDKLFVSPDPICIIFWVTFVLFVVVNGIFLHLLDSNTDEVCFVAPGMPWVAIGALFFNIVLALELGDLTWARFGVWSAIGVVVYLVYGMSHSVEARLVNSSDEEGDAFDPTNETLPLIPKTIE